MTTELLELPEEAVESIEENEDLKKLDQLLADVSMRNSVYAKEILENLPDNPYSAYVHDELLKLVSKINGDELLHSREFLNPLLDYRIYLTTEAPTED